MKFSTAFVAAVAALGAASPALADDAIVGGSVASSGDYRWMVSIQRSGSHFCGGSLIAPNVVLTAAHCTVYSASQMQVRVKGGTSSNSGSESFGVTRIIDNPSYSSSTYNNDAAILILSGSSSVTPIPLDSSSNTWTGTTATVAGWGTLREGGSVTRSLNEVDVPVVSNSACSQSYPGSITNQMICAGFSQGGRDSCQGDSGGPMFVGGNGNPTQVGIVSWGRGCARAGYYGVYARVSQMYNFISSNANLPSGSPSPAPAPVPSPSPGPSNECQCDGGPDRGEVCGSWISFPSTGWDTTQCYITYTGTAEPTCTPPNGGYLQPSASQPGRWVLYGCTAGRFVYVEGVQDEKPTALDFGASTAAPAGGPSVLVIVGATVGAALVTGLSVFAVMQRKVNKANADEFDNYKVSTDTP